MDEQYLKKGLRTRNKIVFDFIFQYYYSGLCAYCERFTGSQQAAEDIVQDFFIALWIKHKQIKVESSLKNYLFISVRNRSLDYLKREQKKSRLETPDAEKALSENLSYLWFAEAELKAAVHKSLEKLPPRCREIFRLNRLNGFKNEEIAQKLGLSKRTVEVQISIALRQLRIDLKEYMPFIFLMLL